MEASLSIVNEYHQNEIVPWTNREIYKVRLWYHLLVHEERIWWMRNMKNTQYTKMMFWCQSYVFIRCWESTFWYHNLPTLLSTSPLCLHLWLHLQMRTTSPIYRHSYKSHLTTNTRGVLTSSMESFEPNSLNMAHSLYLTFHKRKCITIRSYFHI